MSLRSGCNYVRFHYVAALGGTRLRSPERGVLRRIQTHRAMIATGERLVSRESGAASLRRGLATRTTGRLGEQKA